jgi:hypothetical protein
MEIMMNKRELSQQIQENLLTYLDDISIDYPGVLDDVCDIVNNTIMNYE